MQFLRRQNYLRFLPLPPELVCSPLFPKVTLLTDSHLPPPSGNLSRNLSLFLRDLLLIPPSPLPAFQSLPQHGTLVVALRVVVPDWMNDHHPPFFVPTFFFSLSDSFSIFSIVKSDFPLLFPSRRLLRSLQTLSPPPSVEKGFLLFSSSGDIFLSLLCRFNPFALPFNPQQRRNFLLKKLSVFFFLAPRAPPHPLPPRHIRPSLP